MKRPSLLAILLAVSLGAAGCWDYRDINDRSLVLGLAVDLAPGERHAVTLEVATPTGMAAGAAPAGQQSAAPGGRSGGARRLLSAVADTSTEAISSLRRGWERPFNFGHLSVLILGEEYVRAFPRDEFGCAGCHPEISTGMNVLVAQGRAGDFLGAPPPAETYNSIYLALLMRNARFRSAIVQEHTVGQFTATMNDDDVGLLPRLVRADAGLRLSGAAVMKDYRLVGWLDEATLQGVNILRDEGERLVIEAKCLQKGAERRRRATGSFAFGVMSREARVKVIPPEGASGRPRFVYRVKVKGVAMDSDCPDYAATDYQGVVAAEVRARAEKAIRRAQGMGLDFLKLGEFVKRRHPRLYRGMDWREEFPRLPIGVDVDVVVERSGFWHVPLRRDRHGHTP